MRIKTGALAVRVWTRWPSLWRHVGLGHKVSKGPGNSSAPCISPGLSLTGLAGCGGAGSQWQGEEGLEQGQQLSRGTRTRLGVHPFPTWEYPHHCHQQGPSLVPQSAQLLCPISYGKFLASEPSREEPVSRFPPRLAPQRAAGPSGPQCEVNQRQR